jgi:Helix-turn-helix domain
LTGGATIYALTDPDSGEVRYVGVSKSAWRRYASHLLMMKGSSDRVAWIQSLHQQRKVPMLKILEENIPAEHATSRERWGIRHYRNQGIVLVNREVKKPKRATSDRRQGPHPRSQPGENLLHPLLHWRVEYGVTQQELVERAGVTQGAISHFEQYIRRPLPDALERLRSYTGLPTDAFIRPEQFLREEPNFLRKYRRPRKQ